MSNIINSLYFWEKVSNRLQSLSVTPAQMLAFLHLERAVGDVEIAESRFVDLDMSRIEDMIVMKVSESGDDFMPVINGKWFRVVVEDDGYMVLTSWDRPIPVIASVKYT